MHSFFRTRNLLGLGLLVGALLSAAAPAPVAAEPRPGPKKPGGFRLFARSLGALSVNRVVCGLTSDGHICVDSTNSGTIPGASWPKGTVDAYVFNSGLQIAGIVGGDGGPWAGDTTGAFFFDPKGTTEHGEEVEPIYNTSNPQDLAFMADTTASCNEVCLAAKVPKGDANADLFFPLLQGRAAASQGDVWWLSWDGNPSLVTRRPHPLGILVEQRGMGWNFPSGNEDIIYFIYTFYNVTASDPAVYAASGVRPGMVDILARQGALFQQRNEQAYRIDIPDGGYTVENMFAAFAMDADVSNYRLNFSSVNVPFALGYVYDASFQPSTGWTFDPSIFSPPFFPGSGFVGVKYLKSPEIAPGVQAGLSLFSNTINQGAFDDAQDIVQLYRYISNNISPAAGDAPCNTGNPQDTKICFVNNAAPSDMRFFQSSGPLTLAPGQFGSIAVAYIFAAPTIAAGCNGPGSCGVLAPGDPRRLAVPATADNANRVDSVAGFTGYAGDADANGVADQGEFTLPVPGSLLGKALTAQTIFNSKFLLPFAPEAPNFFLVPGDDQVTVLWQPSTSETQGDPFFDVASLPTIPNEVTGDPEPNPLYDPNYRKLDVEGYRIYRGRVDSPNELALIAQFDYSGTFIRDFTGQVNPISGCAPELGIDTACAVPFDTLNTPPTVFVDIPLVGPLVQIALPSGRTALATGEAILLVSDTAMTGGGAGNPELQDTGVPFTFVDTQVRSNIRYFYAVTAFDINSIQSGPSSIESPRITKPVTPAATATNIDNTVVASLSMTGRGVVLDTTAAEPSIDPAAGTFSGPFPPANGWDVGLGNLVSQVLSGSSQVVARLDSIQLGSSYQGVPHTYWFTATAAGSSSILSAGVPGVEEIGITSGVGNSAPIVPVSEERSTNFGGSSDFKLTARAEVSLPGTDYLTLYGRGCVNASLGRPGFTDGACSYNGSRWFSGANETFPDPNGNDVANASGTVYTNYNNAGALDGVTTIHQTKCYESAGGGGCREQTGIAAGAKRAADIKFYWGAGGVVDSVVDVTHNVLVPFDTLAGGTWGILNQGATSVGPSLDASATLTNADFSCVEPFRTYAAGGFICSATGTTPAYKLSNTAVPGAVGFFSGGGFPPAVPIVAAGSPGFVLYVAGEWFTIELTGGALPAAGTVWTLRQYAGAISGGQGAAGDLGPYVFSNPEGIRPMTAVGAELVADLAVTNQAVAATDEDLERVHTVPDPYYVTSQFEQATDLKIIKFVNLPADCIIRIYSSSGVLVDLIEHHSGQFGGSEDWNVRNRNNQVVASGVYFYHIEAGDARRAGRFTIVNFAQ